MIKFNEMTHYPLSYSLSKVFNNNRVRLVTNWKNILQDEEYIDENDSFSKCYSCDNDTIVKIIVNRSNYSGVLFQLFEDVSNYNPFEEFTHSEDYLKFEEIISNLLDDKDYLHLEYCSKCNKILKIDEQLFFTVETIDDYGTFMNILVEEKYLDKDGEPLKCMICDGTEFENKDVYMEDGYETEFSIRCKHCDTIVGHWAYGHFCCIL